VTYGSKSDGTVHVDGGVIGKRPDDVRGQPFSGGRRRRGYREFRRNRLFGLDSALDPLNSARGDFPNQSRRDPNQLRPGAPNRLRFGRCHRRRFGSHRPLREDPDHEADLIEHGVEQRDQSRRRELHEMGSGEEMPVGYVLDRPQPVRRADKADAAVIDRICHPAHEGEWVDDVFEDL